MGEIIGKFGSAMSGFWWSLDEHERRLILIAGVWAAVALLELLAASSTARERKQLVDDVAAELEARRNAR